MNKARLFLIVLCISFALLWASTNPTDGGPIPTEPSYPILKDIQYGFTLQNRTNRILKEAEFWTYAPPRLTSTQRCLKLEVSHPYQLIVDELGNQILHFRFGNLSPHAVKLITIRVSLGLTDIPNPIAINAPFPEVLSNPANGGKNSISYGHVTRTRSRHFPPDDVHPFLQAEKYIESDHPELQQFSKKFESATQRETAERIFRWVAKNISYAGYLRDSRGALYALRNKRGDCTEYMCLFAALCRANRIPARGIGGYICRESSVLEPNSYHNWAEFYEEGAWRMGDPQKNVFMENSSHYIAMRIIGDSTKNPMGEFNRFRFAGDDLKVEMISSRGREGIY